MIFQGPADDDINSLHAMSQVLILCLELRTLATEHCEQRGARAKVVY